MVCARKTGSLPNPSSASGRDRRGTLPRQVSAGEVLWSESGRCSCVDSLGFSLGSFEWVKAQGCAHARRPTGRCACHAVQGMRPGVQGDATPGMLLSRPHPIFFSRHALLGNRAMQTSRTYAWPPASTAAPRIGTSWGTRIPATC